MKIIDIALKRVGLIQRKHYDVAHSSYDEMCIQANDLTRKLSQRDTELMQLKRGQGPSAEDWNNMVGAQLNEVKYRMFKDNLVAHKKLVQIVAGKLGKATNGLSRSECLHLAETIEPDYWLYSDAQSAAKLQKDIKRLLSKGQIDDTNDSTRAKQLPR